MSLRYEQCRSLKKTRDFLGLILRSPRMSHKDLRDHAYSCLHHYPFLNEHGQPIWSHDPFTNDDGSAK